MPDEKKPPVNKVRRQVIESKQYTAIPNFILDIMLPGSEVCPDGLPYEAIHMLLYLNRKIVGWVTSRGYLEASLKQISKDTNISPPLLGRYAHAFGYLGLIQYMPADGDGTKTRMYLYPHGVPNKEQVLAAIQGIRGALMKSKQRRLTNDEFGQHARDFAVKYALHVLLKDDGPGRAALENKLVMERKGLIP